MNYCYSVIKIGKTHIVTSAPDTYITIPRFKFYKEAQNFKKAQDSYALRLATSKMNQPDDPDKKTKAA